MRPLIDMNPSPRWVHTFSKAGHDAVHWSEVGPIDAADSLIREYARENARDLFTIDLFSRGFWRTHLSESPASSCYVASR
jgi:predicted nuclease of predicted toxin-antitoxin system